MLFVEPVDLFGVRGGDLAEAHVFSDDRSAFRFHQAIVSGTVCGRLGLLDQQLCHRVVDELAAIVGLDHDK
jgi:hypothetical protein